MNKLKISIIAGVSILFGVGIVLAGLWFVPGWKDTFVDIVSQPKQSMQVNPAECAFPTSVDMAVKEKYELVRGIAIKCAEFQTEKLKYTFDPKNALTWDNGFPSREDWVRRLKYIKTALGSEWQTYRSEQYGFEFSYPAGWSPLISADTSRIILAVPGSQVVLPMVIDIQRYATALNSGWNFKNEQLFLGKKNILEEKDAIREAARVVDSNEKFVKLGNDYGTFVYHNFYRHGKFFLGDDFFTVTQPLSVSVPDVGGGFGEIQQEILAKINSNAVSDLVSVEMELLDRVAGSFKKTSLSNTVQNQDSLKENPMLTLDHLFQTTNLYKVGEKRILPSVFLNKNISGFVGLSSVYEVKSFSDQESSLTFSIYRVGQGDLPPTYSEGRMFLQIIDFKDPPHYIYQLYDTEIDRVEPLGKVYAKEGKLIITCADPKVQSVGPAETCEYQIDFSRDTKKIVVTRTI